VKVKGFRVLFNKKQIEPICIYLSLYTYNILTEIFIFSSLSMNYTYIRVAM